MWISALTIVAAIFDIVSTTFGGGSAIGQHVNNAWASSIAFKSASEIGKAVVSYLSLDFGPAISGDNQARRTTGGVQKYLAT